MTIDELSAMAVDHDTRIAAIQKQLAEIKAILEKKPAGIDWSVIRAYLPEVRSLIYLLIGALGGGGTVATYNATTAPTKQVQPKMEEAKP